MREFAAYGWIFDIKPETAQQVIDRLKLWCEDNDSMPWLLNNTRFLLWSKHDEVYLKKKLPGAVTLAREPECHRAGIAVLLRIAFLSGIRPGRAYALPPSFLGLKLFKKSFIERYQSRGAKVIAYLPEKPDEIQAALAAGVDEILTNGKPLESRSNL